MLAVMMKKDGDCSVGFEGMDDAVLFDAAKRKEAWRSTAQ